MRMWVLKFYIAYEKILLAVVILFIWVTVILMEEVMPHQSVPVVVLTFFVFYCVLISLANTHQHRKQTKNGSPVVPPNPDYHPSVSIIVPAHNEAAVIADTVKAIMAIDYDRVDLWVFDDRSSDETASILTRLKQSYPEERFQVVRRSPDAAPGKSAVLNDALALTQGEIILVFDADGRVEPDFLKRILPYLADESVGAVQARKMISNAEVNRLTRCQFHEYLMDAHFQTGRDAIRGAVELRGNGQLVKRMALYSVENWTEDTITDDLDLSTKLHLAGWDIRFAADVTVEEEGVTGFRQLLKQRRRWAEGSLKRYLEYSAQIFTSRSVSKRVRLDMMAYFLKFLFPLWGTADLTIQVLNLFWGEWPGHWTSSLIALPMLCVFFISGAFLAIRQTEKAGLMHSLTWALETAVFLLIVWVPVVMWITTKILFAKDHGPLHWGKTEHLGTQAMMKPSRLTRVKNFFQGS